MESVMSQIISFLERLDPSTALAFASLAIAGLALYVVLKSLEK